MHKYSYTAINGAYSVRYSYTARKCAELASSELAARGGEAAAGGGDLGQDLAHVPARGPPGAARREVQRQGARRAYYVVSKSVLLTLYRAPLNGAPLYIAHH